MKDLKDSNAVLYRLFCGAVNGVLSESEHQQLQDYLKTSAAARSLWFEFHDMECGLSELRPFSAGENMRLSGSESPEVALDLGCVACAVPSRRGGTARLGIWAGAAAVVALGCTLGVHYLSYFERQPARIVAMKNTLWASPDISFQLGEALQKGQVLELFSGSVDLRFASGTKATLQAPCIFQVTSENSGYLTFGQVTARAEGAKAKGFIVQTPSAQVVDMGTEFVTSAAENGESRVEVLSGEVQVHVNGELAPQRLVEGNALAIESGRQPVMVRIENGDGTPAYRFPSIEPPSRADYSDTDLGKAVVRILDGHQADGSGPLPHLLANQESVPVGQEVDRTIPVNQRKAGRIFVDLGHVVSVTKINSYSWTRPETAQSGPGEQSQTTQNYVLYGFPGDVPPPAEGIPDDVGWELIGRVNTNGSDSVVGPQARPEQQVSSISAANGSLGHYRFLMWQVMPNAMGDILAQQSSLYSEFDVYAAP